jgi:hypothetical protein
MKERFKRLSKKVLLSYRALPDKKQYVEFFTAVLSVPVLITVILLNLNSLNGLKNKQQITTPNPTPEKIYINQQPASSGQTGIQTNTQPTATPASSQGPCKQQIGPISIASPQEGQTVSDNPTNINISYSTGVYCSVVWSYRINGGNWSDFDNKSIALYNLPQGTIKLDLRVQSTVTDQQETLTRTFTYNGNSTIPTGTSQNNASSSAH